ncbi:MAG: aminotransferase class I/II-fold pyridoxal phosphate-dependent enzyme [Anaerolineales bacterium]|uniref:homocysteine desulfhydrase n=1 Tax=Candidatus Desulfolinea nitratireducens TaxID=2841698 RepID=A0A8J6NGC7_9CHLR|nr:aminotransferase class I/II-fold pyridoxal phosphate-dependent enzyme [Candidatus Desulfolinea nitratireducens]MBL6960929.1 aminotransferase class I/II-fold pyridoxal phosphate-dependent enzyme [Anaerolineales bacterium]
MLKLAGPSTQSVHINGIANPYRSVGEPIVQTATYQFEDVADLCAFQEAQLSGDDHDRIEYGRYGNPTVNAVEKRIAGLENANDALLFSTGMAAITTTLLALLSSGDNIIITDDSYRRTRQFCEIYLKQMGITTTVVPMGDYEAFEAAILPNTRLVISESPTNPYLRTLDLERFVAIAKKHQVKTFIDSTFATPLNIRPLDWGVDLVVHSATKYLGGHNDILAGVVAGGSGTLKELRNALGIFGGISDPHNAALLLRGIKTLGLRVERQNQNGQAISEFLEGQPNVERVWYPGLPSHPDHEIAKQQMSGFGGVVSFTVKGDLESTSRFIDAVKIPLIAASLGAVETLIEPPAIMAYYDLTTEERLAEGISNNLVRLALGIEDAEDIIADLEQALAVV